MPDLLPNSGPGRPKDLEKRNAILEAAKNLFVRHGYAGTSMDAIAGEAGVSKLTVYSHFTDKETLFTAAVMARCEDQLPDLYFTFDPGQPLEPVLLTIGRAFEHLVNSPESLQLHRLMSDLGIRDPQLSKTFFAAGPQRLLDSMQGFLAQVDASGQLRIDSPAQAARHFFSLVKGVDHFRLLVGCCEALDEAEVEAHVQDVVRLFMRAYAPCPARPDL
ncbi:TetR/AcrR family transcriptional regulator [Pseudomonas syringae]|nr:TetR/AcrR family transcriptional regulator [Pseudomonas syringae]MBD8793393.1 TetR/AcrR family transcriptional regulator [Pseudomonas syringae]MBD8802815.1 TetR/AcrR family transcriptional regulator [Pseudomonas syringae]MBD8813387.1 TetR/AcrR family transcriptional regulator [Pseudomonas syringae]